MLRSSPALLAIAPAVLIASLTGVLNPIQRTLDDLRFRLTERDPTQTIVLVDIDAKSIAAEGRWPWPRRIHADLVDQLAALGASDIAFDIDFSSPSDPENDAAFASALERAGGGVVLAALSQPATAAPNETRVIHNRPIDAFAQHAWLASADVTPDSDGQVRRLRFADDDSGRLLPSLAAMMAGGGGVLDGDFRIDFGIRADGFERISVSDVLDGQVDRAKVAGKKVIVGASAAELRDFFTVPAAGTISGSTLQAIAAESIIQKRLIRPTGPLLSFIEILLVTLFAAVLFGRLRWFQLIGTLFALSLGIEAGAVLVQNLLPVSAVTAPVQTAIFGLAVITLLQEIDFRRILLLIARNQTSNAQTILDRVIADNFDGVIVADEGGTIRAASRTATESLGARGFVSKAIEEVLPPDLARAIRQSIHASRLGIELDNGRRETAHFRADGSSMIIEYKVTPTRLSGGVTSDGRALPDTFYTTLTFSNVTEERRAADKIAYLAEYDSLTGLPNRNQLVQRLAWALQAARRTGQPGAVVCFDLDRFTAVNDTLGHDAGDQLLQAVTERARILLSPNDLLGRFGGDEFVVVCTEGNAKERAIEFAERMIGRVNSPYSVKGQRVVAGISFGVAVMELDEIDPLVVLKQADIALHAAKAAGGRRQVLYTRGMSDDLQERRILEFELWEAVMKRDFRVFYQPQVDLESGQITGMEALLRWESPRLGMVSPAEFIPIAETLGLIQQIGQWVLEQACLAATSWPTPVRVSVNVSSLQFLHGDFAKTVSRALDRAGLPASRLEIEITESLFLEENETIRAMLERIREMGVTIALDDFGTGYSALQYLRKFRFDKIKIDRSFIADMADNDESMAIVRAIADLAERLGVRLNAEGIETEQQLALLRILGCQEGQGYLFGRPATAEDTERLVAAEGATAPATARAS